MKKTSILAVAISAAILLAAWGTALQASVQVPVRVFAGEAFLDQLGPQDFELFENGQPQTIEAVALIELNSLKRAEALQAPLPPLQRNFYLWFYVTEYDPKLEESLSRFIREILVPGDTLTVITPVKTYTLNSEVLRKKSVEAIEKETREMLRKDIQKGNMEYKSLIRELRNLTSSLRTNLGWTSPMNEDSEDSSFGLEMNLGRYKNSLSRIETLRRLDDQKLLAFASHLKKRPGFNHVILFYEKEYKPDVENRVLSMVMNSYQDNPYIEQALNDLFLFYNRESSMRTEIISQAFADSASSLSFIFTRERTVFSPDIQMTEKSEDLYQSFFKICKATGGVFETSANPAYALKKVADTIGRYYLLFYTPSDEGQPTASGKAEFRTISVRVKGPSAEVSHRMGYFKR